MEIDGVRMAFNSDDVAEKMELLSHLCDIFESYSEEYGNLNEIIQLLVDFSVSETDSSLKEEYINTLQSAAGNKDISSIELEKIIDAFDSLDHRLKLDVIDVVGFSHNSKYVDFLKDQASSDDAAISSTASMSLEEMTAFLAQNDSV